MSVTELPTKLVPRQRILLPQVGAYTRTLQVIGRVRPKKGTSAKVLFEKSRDVVLDWLEQKKSVALPSEARKGEPWEWGVDAGARVVLVEATAGLWAMRFDDPDPVVHGRMWRVEVAIAEDPAGNAPVLGCTLSVLVPKGADAPISIPGFVTQLTKQLGLVDDGRLLDGRPWHLRTGADVDKLIALIESQDRGRAVVVVSSPDSGVSYVDVNRIANDLAGVAHVATIDRYTANEIISRFGRSLSVFGDAIRLYRVGFDADIDSPYRHPLFVRDAWQHRLPALAWALKFDATQETLARPDENRDMPSFSRIRRLANDRRAREAIENRQSGGETEALTKALQTLTNDAASWEQLSYEEERKRRDAEDALHEAKQRLWGLQARVRLLEEQLRVASGGTDLAPELPETFDDLEEWADRYVASRVVVTPKAIRAARKSTFFNVPLAYQALYVLATQYWEMRVHGGAALRAQLEQALAELGLELSGVGEAVKIARYADQYKVTYAYATYELNQHVVGSDSRNEQYSLRIYFAWDEDQQLVIVGHLPGHLDNTLT